MFYFTDRFFLHVLDLRDLEQPLRCVFRVLHRLLYLQSLRWFKSFAILHLSFQRDFIVEARVSRSNLPAFFDHEVLHSLNGRDAPTLFQNRLYKGIRSSGFKQFQRFLSSLEVKVSQSIPGIGTEPFADFESGWSSAIEKRKSQPGNSVREHPEAKIDS